MTTSDEFIACRTLKHAWDSIPAAPTRRHEALLRLRCTRCATERHDAIRVATGEVVGRRYIYPNGYRKTRDEPRTSADEWRRQFLGVAGIVSKRRRAS